MKKNITIDGKTFWIEDIVLLNSKKLNNNGEIEITLKSSQNILLEIKDVIDFIFDYYGTDNNLSNLIRRKQEIENEISSDITIKNVFSNKLYLIDDEKSFVKVFLKRFIFFKDNDVYKYKDDEVKKLKKEIEEIRKELNGEVVSTFKDIIQELREIKK